MLSGNPLFAKDSSSSHSIGIHSLNGIESEFSVKRRWDDDVIFKNQAKGVDEKPKKRFINDVLRSDFHRKFMSKYIH